MADETMTVIGGYAEAEAVFLCPTFSQLYYLSLPHPYEERNAMISQISYNPPPVFPFFL
ncbi:MAG: hypothetical protein NVS4B12_17840 [Ktedonobacteraceae bacterium]